MSKNKTVYNQQNLRFEIWVQIITRATIPNDYKLEVRVIHSLLIRQSLKNITIIEKKQSKYRADKAKFTTSNQAPQFQKKNKNLQVTIRFLLY